MKMPKELKEKMDDEADSFAYSTGPVGYRNGFQSCYALMSESYVSKERVEKLMSEVANICLNKPYFKNNIDELFDHLLGTVAKFNADQGGGKPETCPPHDWTKNGEQCAKCGTKDWMT